jgi:hypothetical protein
MESSLTAAVWVLAVVSVLWTVGLILAIAELRRLSGRLQEFLRVVEQEFRPTVQEAREVMRNVNRAVQGVSESADRLQGALATFQQAGENVRVTTEAIRGVFGSRLIPVASLLAGLRAGGRMLWTRYMRRRAAS